MRPFAHHGSVAELHSSPRAGAGRSQSPTVCEPGVASHERFAAPQAMRISWPATQRTAVVSSQSFGCEQTSVGGCVAGKAEGLAPRTCLELFAVRGAPSGSRGVAPVFARAERAIRALSDHGARVAGAPAIQNVVRHSVHASDCATVRVADSRAHDACANIRRGAAQKPLPYRVARPRLDHLPSRRHGPRHRFGRGKLAHQPRHAEVHALGGSARIGHVVA